MEKNQQTHLSRWHVPIPELKSMNYLFTLREGGGRGITNKITVEEEKNGANV